MSLELQSGLTRLDEFHNRTKANIVQEHLTITYQVLTRTHKRYILKYMLMTKNIGPVIPEKTPFVDVVIVLNMPDVCRREIQFR